MLLDVCRDEAKLQEVEDEIKRLGSIKKFIDQHKDANPEHIASYNQTMETPVL